MWMLSSITGYWIRKFESVYNGNCNITVRVWRQDWSEAAPIDPVCTSAVEGNTYRQAYLVSG